MVVDTNREELEAQAPHRAGRSVLQEVVARCLVGSWSGVAEGHVSGADNQKEVRAPKSMANSGEIRRHVSFPLRRNPQSHQFTKVGYRVTEEYWDPKEEGLDTLKAIREVPELFVAISQTQLAEDGHEQKSLREFFEYAEGPKRSGARKTNSNHGRAKNPHSKPRDRHRNGVDSQEAT